MEINGSMSMGGRLGSLNDKGLRTYPVPDIRLWDKVHRKELVRLAKAVWKTSKPVDWSSRGNTPKELIRFMDAPVLQHVGAGISTDDLYRDLTNAVEVLAIVWPKTRQESKRSVNQREREKRCSIGYAAKVRPLLDAKLFPESA